MDVVDVVGMTVALSRSTQVRGARGSVAVVPESSLEGRHRLITHRARDGAMEPRENLGYAGGAVGVIPRRGARTEAIRWGHPNRFLRMGRKS